MILYEKAVQMTNVSLQEWGYRAKNSTFRALSQAGFNNGTFKQLKRMMLVSEPEAAAIYTARFLNETYGAKSLPKASP